MNKFYVQIKCIINEWHQKLAHTSSHVSLGTEFVKDGQAGWGWEAFHTYLSVKTALFALSRNNISGQSCTPISMLIHLFYRNEQ